MFMLILISYASHILLIVRKKRLNFNELITWDLRPMLRTTEIEVKFIAPKTTLIVYLFSI